jgi:glycosylphosphatidylinositol transamidase (GPIT) subunit GPI8
MAWKTRVQLQHDKKTDRILLMIDSGDSLYNVWISPEDAIAVGDVGHMAKASREEKRCGEHTG